ncbi:MAG: YciI family protein [Thermoprotei archaeon]
MVETYVCETTWYNVVPDSETRSEHLAYIRKKGAEGKVAASGRFRDLKGALIIWRVSSLEEAQKLAAEDPYFKRGLVKFELREWDVAFNFLTNPPQTPE